MLLLRLRRSRVCLPSVRKHAQTSLLYSRILSGSSAATLNAPSQSVVDETQAIINRAHADGLTLTRSVASDGSQPLLSVLMSSATVETISPSVSSKPTPVDTQPEGSRVLASRTSSTLPAPPGVAAPTPLSNSSSVDASSTASTPATFNPPIGSRLLAFGSRVPPGPVGAEPIPSKNIPALESPTAQLPPGIPGLAPQKASMNLPATHPNMISEAGYGNEPHFHHNGRHNLFEGVRMQRSFSPNSNLSQASGQFDDLHEIQMLGQMAELRRGSAVDRASLGLANDMGSPFGEVGSPNPLDVNGIPGGPNYATGRGSRLARLIDQKARDGPPQANRKVPGMPGAPSYPQMPDPRQGNFGLNGGLNGNGEGRTMEDIFAMLQNSRQVRHG